MIKLGAHLSIAGGYTNPLKKITEIGGNALQIFSSSPRGWNFAQVNDETAQAFVQMKNDLGIDPVYFHASYLVNLADDARTGEMSVKSLINELNLAPRMQVKGSIVHLGSFKNQLQITNDELGINNHQKHEILIQNIKTILSQTSEETLFIIENAGNRKIGQTIEQIAQIIKDVNTPRVRVCLDTCHLHAAGYDVRTVEKLEEFIHMFDSLIGVDKIELWHINDSKDQFGALRDRHENIGQGQVGIDTFKLLLNHPKIKHCTFIIETPGFDDKGPDKENLDILKDLLD
jgi:deoxyribonuclease IV